MDLDGVRVVRRKRSTLGLSFADVLLAMGLLCFLAALTFPYFRARAFTTTLERAVSDVDALTSTVTGIYDRTGTWPPAAGAGEIPEGARGAFPQDTSLIRDGYSLQWLLLESAVRIPAPLASIVIPEDADEVPDSVAPPTTFEVRSLGRLLVRSGDDALLAELLARYGREQSFVRDSTWTLVLPGS